jgi:hypothetical protein
MGRVGEQGSSAAPCGETPRRLALSACTKRAHARLAATLAADERAAVASLRAAAARLERRCA